MRVYEHEDPHPARAFIARTEESHETYSLSHLVFSVLAAATVVDASPRDTTGTAADEAAEINQVLEWNQIFIDTLIATNTPNSSSQRLGAIVHTAIFDAYNGVETRYMPIFVHPGAAAGASR